jgi:type IV pilus assembly protein PilN
MIRVNLLPAKVSRRQEAVRRELVVVGAGLCGIVAVLMIFQLALGARIGSAEKDARILKRQISGANAMVAEVEEAERYQEELTKKLNVIKTLKANKTGPVHMLDEISKATPEKLQLRSLDESGGRVELTGVAVSNDVISEFLTKLEDSDYFVEVYLNAIDQVEEEGVKLKNFSISSKLIVPGAAPLPAVRGG